MPVRDFAQKLKLTAVLLGCTTQKDLCLIFRQINPETQFDLERSYNWVQGRSRPRSAKVYEDWAALLGTGRPTGYLTSCSIDQFYDVVAERFQLSRTEVASMAGRPTATREAAGAEADPLRDPSRPPAYLAGAYACYSHAWSPHFRGKIIRGSLAVQPVAANDGVLTATYSESGAVGRIRVRGPVEVTGRSIYFNLFEAERRLRLFMTLFPPSPPANVLAGVMSGATLVDCLAQPAAARIVMIRAPGVQQPALERSDRYVDVAREPLSGDLAASGLPVAGPQAAELDRLLHAFLWEGGESSTLVTAPAATYSELAVVVDRLQSEMLQVPVGAPMLRARKIDRS